MPAQHNPKMSSIQKDGKTYGSVDIESSHGHAHSGIEASNASSMTKVAWGIAIFQALILVLFGMCNLSPANEVIDANFNVGYSMFSGVLIMMFIGFGYLMTFMDTYGMGAVGFTFALTVIVFEWSLITESYFTQFFAGQPWITADGFSLGIYDCINSLFAVAAILITFGGVIGKLSLWQLFIMVIAETVFYSFNNHFIVSTFHLVDPGGSIIIHCFGAYFGLACAYMVGKPGADAKMSQYADLFSFIGTLFLWIYWPSFVGGALEAGSAAQQRAVVNTILALSGSTLATFVLSTLLNPEKVLRPVDIQNATLAGGVSIGVCASLNLHPTLALLIGISAGSVSCFGFNKIQPFLCDHYNLHDSCGIHNLHGMPSVLGGIFSIVIAMQQNSDQYDPLYAANQWSFQLQALIFTLCCAIATGAVTGILITKLESADIHFESEKFQDGAWWELPKKE